MGKLSQEDAFDTASQKGLAIEIEVTPEMVAAGLEALREHHYGDDLGYMLESVFRAMAYASAAASLINVSK